MQKNIGNIDRSIRLAAGAVILLSGLYFKSWWGLLGLIPVITALIWWCPLYTLFGADTCRFDKRSD